MPKNNNNNRYKKKTFKDPKTVQQMLANSDMTIQSGISQPHNAKKVGMGPNTER